MEFMTLLALVVDSARSIGKSDGVSAFGNGLTFAFLFAQAFVTMNGSHDRSPWPTDTCRCSASRAGSSRILHKPEWTHSALENSSSRIFACILMHRAAARWVSSHLGVIACDANRVHDNNQSSSENGRQSAVKRNSNMRPLLRHDLRPGPIHDRVPRHRSIGRKCQGSRR